MNREIKFRAFVHGHMYYDHSVSISIGGSVAFLDGDGQWREDSEGMITLMQYTGLKDKNGEEIYEGDIVTTDGGRAAGVIWQAYIAKFMLQELAEGSAYLDWFERRFEPQFEVIGNIYEHPHILNPQA